VDRDGDPDLLIAEGNDVAPGPIVLYMNVDGALGAEPAWISEEERYHGHLTIGDVDGDGWEDAAVAVYLGPDGFGDPGGAVVYHNEAGVLHADWEATGFHSFSVAFGDLDLDGDLDLAAATGETYKGEEEAARVFLGDGAGGFEEGWRSPEGLRLDVTWADFDGDGALDLAFASQDTPHEIYHSSGGTLPTHPTWLAPGEGFEGNSLDWGDVDGDGALDLVVSENLQFDGEGVLRLYCGDGLDLCWESDDGAAMRSAVDLSDTDGDGVLDLTAGAWFDDVRVYRGTGSGLQTTPGWRSDADDLVVEALGWADVDGSGRVEAEISGVGLLAIPGRGRVLEVTGGAAAGGWISGAGAVSARYLVAGPRDLAVSDWTSTRGDLVYLRDHDPREKEARDRAP